MSPRATTFLLALLATSLPAQDRQPQHLLRLSFVEGRKTRWKVTNEMSVKFLAGDTPVVQKATITVTFTATVEEVTGECARIAYRVDRIVADYGTDLQGMYYDSDEDEKPPGPLQDFAAMIGESFVVELDDRGRRRRVELPEPVRKLDRRSGMDLMTLSDTILPVTPELPEDPVAVGAKWRGRKENAVIEPHSKYAYVSDYELLSVEHGRARIRHELRVRYADPDNETEKQHGRRVTSVLAFDLGRGFAVSEETSVKVEDLEQAAMRGGMSAEIERTVEELPVEEKKG